MAENLIPGFSLVPESLVEKDKKEEVLIPGFSPVKASGEVEKPKAVATGAAPVTVEKKAVKNGDSPSEDSGSVSLEEEVKSNDSQFEKDFKYFDKGNIGKVSGGSIEERLQKDLTENFSKWGFLFEESGAGDYITVTTTDPDNIQSQEFSVGSFLTGLVDMEGIEGLKSFIYNNRESSDVFLDEVPTFSKEALYEEVKSSVDLQNMSLDEIEAEAEKDIGLNTFANKYFASKGVNYDNYRRLEKEAEQNDEEINFINDKLFETREEVVSVPGTTRPMVNKFEVFKNDYKPTEEEIKKYPNIFTKDGSLIGDEKYYKDLSKFDTDRNGKVANILANPVFQEAEEGMKQALSDVRTDAQLEITERTKVNQAEFKVQADNFQTITNTPWESRAAYFDSINIEQQKLDSEIKNITGKDFDVANLKDYKVKTQEEADKLNDIIKRSNELYNNKVLPIQNLIKDVDRIALESKKLNRLANNTLLLINFNDMASFRGEYASNKEFLGVEVPKAVTGFYNEWKKGAAEGRVNKEFLQLAFGITDMQDEDQLAQVSKTIALEKAYSQGILSTRVFERYQNSNSVAEQMELLQQNPLEIVSSLFSSSISQFWSTGNTMFIPIVGGTTTGYAVAGSAGFVTGPGGVLSTGAAAAAGFTQGMSAWSAYTGFALELGAAYSTVFTQNGVDMQDEDQVLAAISGSSEKYPEIAKKSQGMMDDAFDKGLKRGIPIGLMNLVGGAISKGVINPLASPIRQVGQTIAVKAAIDPLAEGTGELLAQVSAGEEIKATEIFNEMLGGQFGNQSNIAVNIGQNIIMDGQTKIANNLLSLDNMLKSNYKVDEIRKFTTQLVKQDKITQDEANQLIKNAEINSQVNNALQNANKSLTQNVKNKIATSLNVGKQGEIKQRLANLMKEKDLFKGNSEFTGDLQAEIDAILETNSLVNNPIELTSDFVKTMDNELGMVNKVMKNLGISQDLEIVDVDNIDEAIKNNEELASVLNKLLLEENESRKEEGLPQLNSIKEYIDQSFENATNTITPKDLGKQFSLYSSQNLMAQMINDRNNSNRTGQKGFRHETLHFILDQVMSDAEVTNIANELESYMEAESKKPGGAISQKAFNNVRKRLDGYRDKVESGEYNEADYSQEVFTTLSDAINDDDLKFERQNKSFWLKIADDLKDFFRYKVGLNKEEINAKDLNTAEAAFAFIKNYNKAFIGNSNRVRFKKLKGDNKGSTNLRSSERLTVLEEINNLIPQDIVTKEDYDAFVRDRRKFPALFNATFDMQEASQMGMQLEQDGVISNYVKSRSIGNEYPTAIQSVRDRLTNFNPEQKRKDGTTVGVKGFGEFIFANTNFGKLDSRKELAQASEKQRSEIGLTDKEGKPLNIAADDDTTTTVESKKDRVTPRSKIKKASPEFVTKEFENEIETAVLETLETIAANEISVEDPVFKDFVKEVLEGKLTDKTKKQLGLGNNYDFLIKKLAPKLKDILPISYFVKIESQTPVDERIFTKPPVRLTKTDDIDKARNDDKVYLENDKQGVNLYEFKDFTNKSLIDYILPPLKIISKKTGKEVRSGLKGNRKTTTAATLAVELGYDMMVALGNENNLPSQALTAVKLQRKPNMRFTTAENLVLDSQFEDYISDQKFWSKFSIDVGKKNYDFNDPKQLEAWKKDEFPKLVKIFSKDFLINSGAFFGNRGFPFKDTNPTKVNSKGELQANHKQAFIDYLNDKFPNDSDYGPAFEFEKIVNGKKVKFDPLPIAFEKKGMKGKVGLSKKFNNYFGSEDNIENNTIKDRVLKEIFLRIQKANTSSNNIIPAAVGMLRTTSAEQAHFMRKISPVTFRQLGMESLLSGQITEEHALGASLVAKQALLLASDKLVNDNFTGITRNYFQGPISKVNDDKVNAKELGMKEGPQKEDLYRVLVGEISGWIRYAKVPGFNLNTIQILDNKGNKVILTDFYNVGVDEKYRNLPNVIAKQNNLIVQQIRDGISPKVAKQMINEYVQNLADTQEQSNKYNANDVSNSQVMEVSDDMTMEDLLSKAITLDKALLNANSLNQPIKKIRVFDFDDTLATSNNIVKATSPDGKIIELNAEEFAKKGLELKEKGYTMNFDDFNNVTDGSRGPLFDVAQTIKDKKGNEDLYVLTARAPEARDAIYEFLKAEGLEFKRENIIGLGNSTGVAKANWLIDKAAEGYNDFYFADDAYQNVKAVKQVMGVVDVKSKVQQARMRSSEDLSTDFNKLLEETTGIEFYKEYSAAKAKTIGASKGRFKFFIPYSAEDYLGLIYPTLSKGSKGDAQMAWYKQNILDPYTKAQENLSRSRLNLMNDFKALKKDLNVPKNLRKKNSTGMTNEQAVRVFLFTSMGYEVPGLSKADLKELTDLVANDPQLLTFSEQILLITKGDGYSKPKAEWLTGTITTDLIDLINTEKRGKYLQEWQQNVDAVYSTENLNKLEAIYGVKYREAMEGILARMKNGRNRLDTGSRLSNKVLDYINGSIGTIMFFNTRSAVLQTISSINFINWSFNNPARAGIAFANQKQYWTDFMKLMNSDYLLDRRNGLKLNINESEIADAASTSKNKAKAAINYILQKGYLPTQYADSFAIASGGATFYRNRIKDLMKNSGMTEAEAEAQALVEFRQVSEESQQSSDPSKISAQQASSLGRVILAFANTPMQYARIQKRAIQDLINGRGDAKSHISRIAYYGFIQNVIFNALQQAVFALGFGDDDEDDEKFQKGKQKKYHDVANGMLDSQLRGLGIAGQAVSIAKNFLLNVYERSGRKRPEYVDSVYELMRMSPPIYNKISKLKQAAWQFDSKKRRQKILDMGPLNINNPAYEAGAKVISATTNVPIDRLFYKMKNLEGAMNEENDLWQRIAMLGGWPKWQLETPKSEVPVSEEEKQEAKENKSVERYKAAKGSTDYETIKKLTSDQQIKMLRGLGYGDYTIKNAKTEKAKIDLIIYKNKGGKVKVDKKAVDTAKYKALNKADQVRKLDSLGLSKSEIAKLKYEQDRVDKLLELMK